MDVNYYERWIVSAKKKSKPIKVTFPDGNIVIFKSQQEVSNKLNIERMTIRDRIKGKTGRLFKNFKFEYIKEGNEN